MPHPWIIRGRTFDPSAQGWIMGVLNVTPDSFSDGGRFLDPGRAVEHGLRMAGDGAAVLDVGGESTRPGALPVSLEEERRRVLPVIRALRPRTRALLSVDTMKPGLAQAALESGADIVNDVGGLCDPRMIELAARSDAGLVLMHMRGTPATMQEQPRYRDVVAEVREFFSERLAALREHGIPPERVALDPGIGFGKTPAHNLELLRRLEDLRVEGRPIVVGVSRKSILARLLENEDMARRRWPTVALTAWLREAGADVLRVHDVRENFEALRMITAILGARPEDEPAAAPGC